MSEEKKNSLIKKKGENSSINHFKEEVSAAPKRRTKEEGFTAVRIREEDMKVIDDIYYAKRYKSKADVVRDIIKVYLEATGEKE